MSKSRRVDDMSPQDRRLAVAAILARGVLRYCSMARKTACSAAGESAHSGQNCLGTDADSRPCVPTGSGGYGPRDPEKGQQA